MTKQQQAEAAQAILDAAIEATEARFGKASAEDQLDLAHEVAAKHPELGLTPYLDEDDNIRWD